MAFEEAEVTETGTSMTYKIAGKQTIASDGIGHKVTVAQLELDGELEVIAVPKLSPVGHLKCKIKNTSAYTLLAGPTASTLFKSLYNPSASD